MNGKMDCIWYDVLACDVQPPCMCGRYVSAASGDGAELSVEYERDVDAALKPLEGKWKLKMNKYERNGV